MLSNEEVQDIIGFGDPTQQELHLVQLGYDAARKQDAELIRKMLEAMTQNASTHGLVHMMEENRQRAIAAARARLEPKP